MGGFDCSCLARFDVGRRGKSTYGRGERSFGNRLFRLFSRVAARSAALLSASPENGDEFERFGALFASSFFASSERQTDRRSGKKSSRIIGYRLPPVSSHDPESDSPKSSTKAVEHYSGTLHEVSNALTVVLGWLDRAGRASTLEEAREALQVAHEHARRGQSMARRGIGAEVAHDHRRRMASELVQFAATSVGPQAARGAVEVLTDISEGTEVRVEADSSVLQILTNLLLNAVEFSPPGARVVVSVRRADQGLVFRVADEGPGIAPERMCDLFTAPVSTRPGGAGIGLPYSRTLAHNHGGDLRLVPPSERGGAPGACFELEWPYARSSPVSSGPPESVRVTLRGARVLLIEDDLSISSLIELTFDAYGARVLALTSEEEVDKTLQNTPVFDAALIDLSPLKGRLIPSLQRLRELAPGAPLILMSGEPGGVPEEAQGYFASWVRKPFDMDQLLRSLSDLLQPADE